MFIYDILSSEMSIKSMNCHAASIAWLYLPERISLRWDHSTVSIIHTSKNARVQRRAIYTTGIYFMIPNGNCLTKKFVNEFVLGTDNLYQWLYRVNAYSTFAHLIDICRRNHWSIVLRVYLRRIVRFSQGLERWWLVAPLKCEAMRACSTTSSRRTECAYCVVYTAYIQ